jgi:GNAT superfamily N-acetyltransferase
VAHIRLARPLDGPDLARLRWEYAAENQLDVPPLEGFSREFLGFLDGLDPALWGIFVAVAGDQTVGTVSIHLIERAPRPVQSFRWKGYITSAYVMPPWRNAGIGTALLDAAVRWARDRGAGTIIVWPSERSISFYRRAGFGDSVALELSPDSN